MGESTFTSLEQADEEWSNTLETADVEDLNSRKKRNYCKMVRSKSSQQWLDRHFRDDYVKRAHQEGYRSRAAYKLLEIQEKDRLLRPGIWMVDLGAAPGGWSQVAANIVGCRGRVVALDLLPMKPIPGVDFIQADFCEQVVLSKLGSMFSERRLELVISDMAPNVSGMNEVDQPRAMYLSEIAVDFAEGFLQPGGDLVVKVFQGQGFETLLKRVRGAFSRLSIRKPRSFRPESRELYLVAQDYKAKLGCPQ